MARPKAKLKDTAGKKAGTHSGKSQWSKAKCNLEFSEIQDGSIATVNKKQKLGSREPAMYFTTGSCSTIWCNFYVNKLSPRVSNL